MFLSLAFQESNTKYEDIFQVNTFGGFLFESTAHEFGVSGFPPSPRTRNILVHTPSVPFSYILFPFLFYFLILLTPYSCRHTVKADSMNCKEISSKPKHYIQEKLIKDYKDKSMLTSIVPATNLLRT